MHKILLENQIKLSEFNALPFGTTLHIQNMGSFQKIDGWGRNEVLLLDVMAFTLHAPEAILLFDGDEPSLKQ